MVPNVGTLDNSCYKYKCLYALLTQFWLAAFTAGSDGEPQSHFTDTASHTQRSDSSSPSQSSNAPADSVDTYRWVEQLSDSEAESQRLELYKLRRRQRYEAAARRAIAAATTTSSTGTFLARINMSDRQPLKMPSIFATNSSVSMPLYRNTVGSMTKLSTTTCWIHVLVSLHSCH